MCNVYSVYSEDLLGPRLDRRKMCIKYGDALLRGGGEDAYIVLAYFTYDNFNEAASHYDHKKLQ